MFSAMLLHMVLILCYLRFCPVFGFEFIIYLFLSISLEILVFFLCLSYPAIFRLLLAVVSLYVLLIVVLSASLLVLISVTFSFFLFYIVFVF